jgi:hypothetical protein
MPAGAALLEMLAAEQDNLLRRNAKHCKRGRQQPFPAHAIASPPDYCPCQVKIWKSDRKSSSARVTPARRSCQIAAQFIVQGV